MIKLDTIEEKYYEKKLINEFFEKPIDILKTFCI